MRDDDALYERLCLEAFQSGLSWLTILRKRENFRAAFARLRDRGGRRASATPTSSGCMADAGIVRNRAKIEAAIANARAPLALHERRRDARRAAVVLRARAPSRAPRAAAGHAGDDARVEGAREGAEAPRLSLRRPDDGLRR